MPKTETAELLSTRLLKMAMAMPPSHAQNELVVAAGMAGYCKSYGKVAVDPQPIRELYQSLMAGIIAGGQRVDFSVLNHIQDALCAAEASWVSNVAAE